MTADGYRIVTYLRGEQVAELNCESREEAEDILTSLTSIKAANFVTASDSVESSEICVIKFDIAEMRLGDKLVAVGINPNST